MSAKITVTIEGATDAELRTELADILLDRMLGRHEDEDGEPIDSVTAMVDKKLRALLDKSVDAKVRELVETLGREVVSDTINKIVANGIPQTDEYGSLKKTVPWDEFVFGRVLRRDGYNRTTFSDIAAQCIDKLLKGELEPVMREAVAKVKAEIDTALGAKLKESIRGAIGV